MKETALCSVTIGETDYGDYQVTFKTENLTVTKEFDSADGHPANTSDIRNWLMGQIANNLDLIKRTLAKL